MVSSGGEHEVDEQPSCARASRGAAIAHSSVPAANLSVVDRESQRLAGRALDAAEAETQRATRVIPEAAERDGDRRNSDDEHGGGGADGRAGGDVRHRRRGGACGRSALNALAPQDRGEAGQCAVEVLAAAGRRRRVRAPRSVG